jgi:hypothetical protein
METGYDLEPRPIGRSTHRRVWFVILAAVLFLAVVLVKPWSGQPRPDPRAGIASPPPATPPAFAVVPITGPPAQNQVLVWPAAAVASGLADATADEAEGALGALAVRSGAWGVGDAGVGPRMLRDEPWTDWTVTVPEAVDGGPLHVVTWPGTSLCDGFPTIYDHPSLVAVTAPADLVPDWRLVGWWTDGSSVAALADSVRQVSPAGNRGISYLERTDRAAWPAGRYEFHVVAGQTAVALTVCITRLG